MRALSSQLHINVIMNCLTFLLDVGKSYVNALWLLSYFKSEGARISGGQLPVKYSFYLENIGRRIRERVDQKTTKDTNYWSGIKALNDSLAIENLLNKVSKFEQKMIQMYTILGRKNVSLWVFEEECRDVVSLGKELTEEFKSKGAQFAGYNRLSLAFNYFNTQLIFDTSTKRNLKAFDNQRFTQSEITSRRAIVLLRVGTQNVSIHMANSNALELFQVHTLEELCNHSINQFMPRDVGKAHNSYIRDYLNNGKTGLVNSRTINTFLITKEGNPKQILISVRIEYHDKDYLYIAGIIVPIKYILSLTLVEPTQ